MGQRTSTAATATNGTGTPRVSVQGVSKVFFVARRKFLALSGVSLDVGPGEFVGLVGPSGCGKSTVMNIVAGIEKPDRGKATYNGQDVVGLNAAVGYMTQKDTFLPWRSILANVALPVMLKGGSRRVAMERAQAWLALVGLQGFEHHQPAELSGGMLKRAALARTLVADPDTVLMDEPFGNVDAQIRIQLHSQLLSLFRRQRCTIIFVTHDLEEAVVLCDRVVVFSPSPGRVTEIVKVDLPRPRDAAKVRFTPEFQEIHAHLWNVLVNATAVD